MNSVKSFDWLSFNLSLSGKVLTGLRKAIVIDPSFISKSGSHTPWGGYFWSGCSGRAKRGLEILGIGLVDVDLKGCFSLEAVQTPDTTTLENHDAGLIDCYLAVLEDKKDKLLTASAPVVADAYFSKKNFVDGLSNMGFQLISRFRDDAVLFYPTTLMPTGRRGRPKRFDGKIDLKNLDVTRFEKITLSSDDGNLYSGVVYAKSLKRLVKLVIWISKDRQKHKLYFSTDTSLSGGDLIDTYRARFLIEFNFRDAKQFTGLNQCQARDLSKLKFNVNASLTAVNIAKVLAKERGMRFSMHQLKQ